ncbi:hypothetical protein B0I35DRAFT_334579, partial [Stachybotrys elegans]
MYRHLLHQIFEECHDLRDELLVDQKLIPSKGDLNLSMLKRIFTTAVSRLGQRWLVCYIDALDECDQTQIHDVMEPLETIARDYNEHGQFRAFCSSRHYENLSPSVGIVLKMDRLPGHIQDLKRYINDCLKVKDVPGLAELLFEKSNGIFLWVVLVIRVLNRNGVPCSIHELKEGLPDGLYNLFRMILERDISDPIWTTSKLRSERPNLDLFDVATTWIMYGHDLTIDIFPHALESGMAVKRGLDDLVAIKTNLSTSRKRIEKTIISATKGLAEVKRRRHCVYKVQFIHESVRTFL